MAGHWALWEKYIEHGDISIGNLMCDPETKRGVLNDLDLARVGGPARKPSAKDNTGTMPFLALDLLNRAAFEGQVPRRYRHDAESFAWCLIYICVCMGKDGKGQIRTVNPHPLSSWFGNMDTSQLAKQESAELNNQLPLHERIKPLAKALHNHWVSRFEAQKSASRQGGVGGCELGALADTVAEFMLPAKEGLQPQESYEEPSDDDSFKEMLQVVVRASGVIPEPLTPIYIAMLGTIRSLYPFAFA